MTQNIYDNDAFRSGYSRLRRSRHGLDGAPEWPVLRSMLPQLDGARVADLGCGFGWFSQWAHEQGAASVLGIDVSEKMLERATTETPTGCVEYRRADLEHLDLPARSIDVAYSSLALHYVAALPGLLGTVRDALEPGGTFVFSVEHPIFSAGAPHGFTTTVGGTTVWPVSTYLVEGERTTTWFVDGVVKQHRTVATYVNELIAADFRVDLLDEWGPTDEQIAATPALAEERHRPAFLLIRASRPA